MTSKASKQSRHIFQERPRFPGHVRAHFSCLHCGRVLIPLLLSCENLLSRFSIVPAAVLRTIELFRGEVSFFLFRVTVRVAARSVIAFLPALRIAKRCVSVGKNSPSCCVRCSRQRVRENSTPFSGTFKKGWNGEGGRGKRISKATYCVISVPSPHRAVL